METLDLPTIGCYATNIYATVLEWRAYPLTIRPRLLGNHATQQYLVASVSM
jgi:hypothetical protein